MKHVLPRLLALEPLPDDPRAREIVELRRSLIGLLNDATETLARLYHLADAYGSLPSVREGLQHDDRDILSLEESARKLSISRRALLRLRTSGRLREVRMSEGRVGIRRTDLARYVESL